VEIIKYKVETASASLRFVYGKILSNFPGVGTDAFAALCRNLSPFGLTVEDVSSPQLLPNKLSDAFLQLELLRRRVQLKIGYGWFDVVVGNLTNDELEIAPLLVETIVETLRSGNEDAFETASAGVAYLAHLSVSSGEQARFFSRHVPVDPGVPQLKPDGFQYATHPFQPEKGLPSLRFTFARSTRIDGGIYVESTFDFAAPLEINSLVGDTVKIVRSTLTAFDLQNLLPIPAQDENKL
jgi:hypothetical protein